MTVFAFLFVCLSSFAQQLVVTAEGHHGAAPGVVTRDDISAEMDGKPAKITGWTHLAGDQAALELYIVIDDGTDTDLGLQFGALKDFIHGLPPGVQVGLAYLRNGMAVVLAPVTAGREEMVKALRLPIGFGGIAASPYIAISDLVKKWPESKARREVLLISSGTDPYEPHDLLNPYLQTAIEDAQRAGIVVHSIYYPGAGHWGHTYWRINWGENYLSELGDGTGGEAYWQGPEKPVGIESYLKDFALRLENQYLLALDKDDLKSGLHRVRVVTSKPGISLVAAEKVFIPDRRPAQR
jgi:hypothetical protein